MSQEYKYTLNGTCGILTDIIKMNDVLRPLIVNVNATMNADGTIPADNVVVTMNKVLIAAEEDILIDIINGFATNPITVRAMIEENVMAPARQFGMDFLEKFSANNIYLGKTTAQVNALMESYPDLIHACITGSLLSLHSTMASMAPDANISQPEIDEFKKRIEIYLGIA